MLVTAARGRGGAGSYPPLGVEMSFGDWEGLTYAQLPIDINTQLGFLSDPIDHPPPGGEPSPISFERIQVAFTQLVQDDETGGTHSDPAGRHHPC